MIPDRQVQPKGVYPGRDSKGRAGKTIVWKESHNQTVPAASIAKPSDPFNKGVSHGIK
jgi:hypothetical protein